MINILKADFLRLRNSIAFRISLIVMLLLSAVFMFIQATAMDYTVPLSRVIFLPLSLYGVTMAAFVSVFVGTDFSDGFIRNKLLVTDRRSTLVLSQIIVNNVACIIVYCTVTAFSAGVGRFFFENNVNNADLILYFLWGIGMCLSTGCMFSVISILCGNKTHAVIVCMGLAFGMLFLCMHTNAVLVQQEYKDGLLNPHYTGGIKRIIYGILHDANPCGQAAQLSAWEVWHPVRGFLINLLMIFIWSALGCSVFRKKDIK